MGGAHPVCHAHPARGRHQAAGRGHAAEGKGRPRGDARECRERVPGLRGTGDCNQGRRNRDEGREEGPGRRQVSSPLPARGGATDRGGGAGGPEQL